MTGQQTHRTRQRLPRHSRRRTLTGMLAMALGLAMFTPAEAGKPTHQVTTVAGSTVQSAALAQAKGEDPKPAKGGRPTPKGPKKQTSCGPVIHKADGTPWTCTLAENFDGDALDRDLWLPQRTDHSGWQHGNACVVDDEENIEVSGGTLKLHTRKQDEPFTCKSPWGAYEAEYTAASISTYQRFTQAYGRFEFRAKFPDAKVPGIHSALWMWPEDDQKYGPWPHSGEIDIAEFYSTYPDRLIPMLHYDAPMHPGDDSLTSGRTNYWCTLDPTQWTTYAAEWTPRGITITYGDQVCLDHEWAANPPLTGSQPFDQPFMLAISQGIGEAENKRTADTPALATLEVDWVKVWS
ncbi:family 16 glycosylhydrolase [Aeromicrobium sp. CTD01-1L150]|uniref:glycoside hydrolase family 16 protein n=1 Tax=Aeromicrobium sp. CTD01-1L150 TaxID=3341830 RepID=UPI0035C1FD97